MNEKIQNVKKKLIYKESKDLIELKKYNIWN